MKKVLILLALATSIRAMAAQQSPTGVDNGTDPHYTITRDHNYIYVKRPKALIFDNAQQDAFRGIDKLIREQLAKLTPTGASDPDGDLQALTESMAAFQKQVDALVQATGGVYNDVKRTGWKNADPTALIIFAGVEYDANFVKVVSGGGSVMVGLVLMPVEVNKYRIDTREFVGTETNWDTAWIAIPSVNVGPGVVSAGGGNQPRAGVGLVWGGLKAASEVSGMTVGPSATVQLWKGINVKVLALKNASKAGAVNNTILMVGLEPAGGPNNVSILNYAAELHISVSGIVPLASLVSPITNFVGITKPE